MKRTCQTPCWLILMPLDSNRKNGPVCRRCDHQEFHGSESEIRTFADRAVVLRTQKQRQSQAAGRELQKQNFVLVRSPHSKILNKSNCAAIFPAFNCVETVQEYAPLLPRNIKGTTFRDSIITFDRTRPPIPIMSAPDRLSRLQSLNMD